MKTAYKSLVWGVLVFGLAVAGCSHKTAQVFSIPDQATAAQLKQFVLEKKIEADSATNEPAPQFAAFFAAAQKGDWLAVSNTFLDLRKHAAQYQSSSNGTDPRLHGTRWQAVIEIWGAFYAFGQGDEKYSAAFGHDVIQSIPPGSIYLGGTDPGRFIVTALQKSQVKGDPFFTLTQNELTDGAYLDYARSLYGKQLYIPTRQDLERCFKEYSSDALDRLSRHELKPGEDVRTDANGDVRINNQLAVIGIRTRMAKVLFERNANCQFYLEESFPLHWMYPHLEPHGLIMKLNREPAETLSEDVLRTDHDYWLKCIAPIIGAWLNDSTTVQELAEFVEKTYVKHDLNGFKGDPEYLSSDYAQKTFSKLRHAQGGLYSWRAGIPPMGEQIPREYAPKNDAAKQRFAREADFAFKQAFALCPSSAEVTIGYVAFLMSEKRKADALLIAQTASHADPKNSQLGYLLQNLSR